MGEDAGETSLGDATDADFERELRNLLLASFADGVEVSGDWTISTAPDRLPDWRVTVERRDGSRPTG